MTELHELTAVEQLTAMALGEVSSVELTEHYLARIVRLDDRLRSYISVFPEHALTAAAAADSARASGEPTGALHGLPLAFKDMHPTAGLRTTFGSRVFADLVPPSDGPAVAPLRAAGAIVLGKTNVPEFGPTCYTDNDLHGETVTPYGETLSPSGSSGGSAAAVAAGLAPLAHGSDGLGSIRTPAANCGLVGVKPTRGRVAGSGAGWLSLGVEGPLARNVADAALLLDALGGPTPSDLWRRSASGSLSEAARRAPGTLRVGRLVDNGRGIAPDASCLAGLDRTVAALSDLGHEVEDVPVADLGPVDALHDSVLAMLGSSIGLIVSSVVAPEQQELLMPYTRWLVDRPVSGVDLARAQATLYGAAMRYQELLTRYDVVVSPTTTAPPQPTAALRADDAEDSLAAMAQWSAYTPAANIAGTPAVSIPSLLTDAGLPIGTMLSGPVDADGLLLSLAAQLEPVLGWTAQHPAIWHD